MARRPCHEKINDAFAFAGSGGLSAQQIDGEADARRGEALGFSRCAGRLRRGRRRSRGKTNGERPAGFWPRIDGIDNSWWVRPSDRAREFSPW